VTNTLSDNTTREIYLLEDVSIQGRKTELRQLLKLLNLAKTGQPKAALITGDAGIGKTALLEAFVKLVRESVYCRTIDLGRMTYATPEAVYVTVIDRLRDEANLILDDALVAVNDITRELDLHWERSDLIRAIALVKLQESIGGKDAVSQEQLMKAIRSQVPALKKLRLSVNEKIEKLVDLLVNPWVMVATSLINPMHPPLQDAIRLAERLKAEAGSSGVVMNLETITPPRTYIRETPVEASTVESVESHPASDLASDSGPGATSRKLSKMPQSFQAQSAAITAHGAGSPQGHASVVEAQVLEPAVEKASNPELNTLYADGPDYSFLDEGIVSAPRPVRRSAKSEPDMPEELAHPAVVAPPPMAKTVALPPVDESFFAATGGGSAGSFVSSLTPVRADHFERPSGNPLIQHLMTVLDFINGSICNIDSGLLIVLDEWDRILNMPEREAMKSFFSEWLYQLTERKNAHLMMVITARTEGESYTLGGSIYNHFRTKMLLDPLSEAVCRKWSQECTANDEVNRQIFRLSRGNPYWHFQMLHYMRERLESNRVKFADADFFAKMGVDTVESIPELSLTRLKLAFLNDEEALYKVIAALVKRFGAERFSAGEAIRELSMAQGFTDGYVFEVLRALFRHGFIHQSGEQLPGEEEPRYIIQSRLTLEFLQQKTRSIETDISTNEKMTYLKKIIPLSIRSGDLDREKTREILALGEAMPNPEDIQSFLEELFLEALQDEKAIVRVTALNNIALIDSPRARDALFAAMRDESPMVREYAASNLAMLSRKTNEPTLLARIMDVMVQDIDDESDVVRTQIYGAIAKYRGPRDLTTVFVKGLSDSCDAVRLIAIRNLSELTTDSPYAFNGLLEAITDPLPDIRRYACLGLQKYPVSEAIEAIARLLRQDSHSGIRAMAAEALSRMEDARAFPALVTALRTENAEDVKLAVARALGKRRGWQTEVVLQEALRKADSEAMPVFVWAGVRSLGQVGGSDGSLELLSELQNRVDNPIILSAMELARHKIEERLNDLQQRKRQMEDGIQIDTATRSRHEEDITLYEEEAMPS
jgi:HEAT repeat protein/Cdc6-like AAA superfamily ATPase